MRLATTLPYRTRLFGWQTYASIISARFIFTIVAIRRSVNAVLNERLVGVLWRFRHARPPTAYRFSRGAAHLRRQTGLGYCTRAAYHAARCCRHPRTPTAATATHHHYCAAPLTLYHTYLAYNAVYFCDHSRPTPAGTSLFKRRTTAVLPRATLPYYISFRYPDILLNAAACAAAFVAYQPLHVGTYSLPAMPAPSLTFL